MSTVRSREKRAQRTPMARTGIERLNRAARRIERAGKGGPQAVIQAAAEAGLVEAQRYEGGILYRTPRGRYVFGWINHRSLADGCGFDDQIED